MSNIKCYAFANHDNSCFASYKCYGFNACRVLIDGNLRNGFCPFYKPKSKGDKNLRYKELPKGYKYDLTQILEFLEDGKTNKEIAEIIGCSERMAEHRRLQWKRGVFDAG